MISPSWRKNTLTKPIFGMARKAPIPSKCVGQIEHVALLSKSHLCGRGRWPVVSVIRAASGVPNVPAGFPILFDADMDRKYDRILASIGIDLAHLSLAAGHA